MIGKFNDKINFPHELLLTNRPVANLRHTLAKNLSTDIKLSKVQLSKMIKSGGFLGRLLDPLLKTRLPLMKNAIKPLAKCVLIPLGLTAVASAADAGIYKKILGSRTTTLIILNAEMEDIKIVKSLEDSGLLFKGVVKQFKMNLKNKKGDLLACY